MIDKDHGILPDTSVEGPPFDTLNWACSRKNGLPGTSDPTGSIEDAGGSGRAQVSYVRR